MDKLITFITIIAWVLGIGSTLLMGLRMRGYLTYSDREQLLDAARGIQRTFPLTVPSIIALICWSWILTF